MTARVGAARKKVLIQPARTEASTIASAPRIKPRRQAVSRVFSDMGYNSFNKFNRSSRSIRRIGMRNNGHPQWLRQKTQIDQAVDLGLGQLLRQELVSDAVFNGRLQAADRFQGH